MEEFSNLKLVKKKVSLALLLSKVVHNNQPLALPDVKNAVDAALNLPHPSRLDLSEAHLGRAQISAAAKFDGMFDEDLSRPSS